MLTPPVPHRLQEAIENDPGKNLPLLPSCLRVRHLNTERETKITITTP